MKISTVINYCTNEYRFINTCINSVKPFSNQIIVPVSNHFFDGEKENKELLDKTYQENLDADFIEYEWQEGKPSQYWVNMSRIIGTNSVKDDSDWILFLDSDEIIDFDSFGSILKKIDDSLVSLKLGCYWYFREPIYRATTLEDSTVLVKKDWVNINPDIKPDREQMHEFLPTKNKIRMVLNNGIPPIHHFSWVRTKEQMLKKVNSWGHNIDKDWKSLVEEEFSRPFNGTCFVNDYKFETVDNIFNL
jgi:hypothetical protein